MSILYKGDFNEGITIDQSGISAKRKLVFVADRGEKIRDLRSHSAFPAIGSAHPDDSSLFCSEISVAVSGKGTKICYIATVSYHSSSDGNGILWGRAFDLSMSAVENVVPFEFSYDQENSAGEPVYPVAASSGSAISAAAVKVSLQISFSYYLQSFDPGWIPELSDTVNKNSIRVCGILVQPECALIKTLGADFIHPGCRKVSIVMEINADGFIRTFPDKSLYCRGANGNPVRIYTAVNSSGNAIYGPEITVASNAASSSTPVPVDTPLWLDGHGNVQQNQKGTGFQPVMLSFKEKRPVSWACLSLPENI